MADDDNEKLRKIKEGMRLMGVPDEVVDQVQSPDDVKMTKVDLDPEGTPLSPEGLAKALGLDVEKTEVKEMLERAKAKVAEHEKRIATRGIYARTLSQAGKATESLLERIFEAYDASLHEADPAKREDIAHKACHELRVGLGIVIDLMGQSMPCVNGKEEHNHSDTHAVH